MKKNIFLLGFTSLSAFTYSVHAKNTPSVLIEKISKVGFTPIQYAGTYSFQILTNGKVIYIDNHDQKTEFLTLSKKTLQNIKNSITKINDFNLKDPGGPECVDAPHDFINVHTNNQNYTIWKFENCKTFTTTDPNAEKVSTILNKLKNAFEEIEN